LVSIATKKLSNSKAGVLLTINSRNHLMLLMQLQLHQLLPVYIPIRRLLE
jgi:hypothetical protein